MLQRTSQGKVLLHKLSRDELDIAYAILEHFQTNAEELVAKNTAYAKAGPPVVGQLDMVNYAKHAKAWMDHCLEQLEKVDGRQRGIYLDDPYRDLMAEKKKEG